jgi:3-deoxy-D-manno-octulosonic-acid transferase
MFFIYQIGILLYSFAIRIAAIRSEKARLWINGRKNQTFENIRKPGEKWIWFHCASLGEFEQGRPVMEAFKLAHPHWKILLSFYSPSGYEVRKNYAGADCIVYLPSDTPKHVAHFLNAFEPSIAVIVKYEFWFGYLRALKKRSIPTFLISSRFRADQHFFKAWGGWFRKQLHCFTEIHVQDEASAQLLHNAGYSTCVVSGDSRYDRVASNAKAPAALPIIERWLNGRKALVIGSNWAEDDAVLFPWKKEDWALIIATHEIDEERLKEVENSCGCSSVRYSTLKENPIETDALILDNVGMLLSAYALGKMAYVGGAFGKGLHNILEPAACGLPVIFGPKYTKFLEAFELIEAGGGISIHDRLSFTEAFNTFSEPSTLQLKSEICATFVKSRTGATSMILQSFDTYI